MSGRSGQLLGGRFPQPHPAARVHRHHAAGAVASHEQRRAVDVGRPRVVVRVRRRAGGQTEGGEGESVRWSVSSQR